MAEWKNDGAPPIDVQNMGRAITPFIPPGWATLTLTHDPGSRMIWMFHNLAGTDIEKRLVGLMIGQLMSMSPEVILQAFELERQARIAKEIGRETVQDPNGPAHSEDDDDV